MQQMGMYLLKMLCCSSVLMAYYWFALRNERFHQWNRFYLLAAMLLSVVVPLLRLPLLHHAEPVVDMVQAMPWNRVVVRPRPARFGLQHIAMVCTVAISVLLLWRMLRSIFGIWHIYHKGKAEVYQQVSLIVTDEPSAPFSFFRWLFWRSNIDPDGINGRRMLQHELTHIREHHSADKLFTELLLVVFWMNPLLWLMRRELYAIHEFLADRKAIAHQDGAAFAAMLLQALQAEPAPFFSSPFFSSQIKRRLTMITTSREPRYSYLRRLSGLMLMVCTAVVLILTIDQAQAQEKKAPPPPPPPPPDGQWLVLPDSIKKATVVDKKGVCYIAYEMKDGRKFTYELNEAAKKGYFIPPPPPPPPVPKPAAPPSPPAFEAIPDNILKAQSDPGKEPVYFYAGLEITAAQAAQLKPEQIASLEVFSGEAALKQYGEKGKNGVIKIVPSMADYSTVSPVNPVTEPNAPSSVNGARVVVGRPSVGSQEPMVVTGYKQQGVYSGPKPLMVLSGRRITDAELQQILPENIARMDVLKGEAASAKYGADGENGVIEITLKNEQQAAPEAYDRVFTVAEEMPSFPGGPDAWKKYLSRNLQYPKEALDKASMGTVTVEFTVLSDGSIRDIRAVKDPGDGLGDEAVRIIKVGPKWKPAQQNGHNVAAKARQDITFRLE